MFKIPGIFMVISILLFGGISLAQSGPPSITTQPVDVSAKIGDTATFAVVAIGASPLTYQWYASVGSAPFSAMAGQTSASRTTGALALANNGNRYYCVVSNSAGSVQSNTVTLTVRGLPAVSVCVSGTGVGDTCAKVCGYSNSTLSAADQATAKASCLNNCKDIPPLSGQPLSGGVSFGC